tara:strand:+ start:9544 stop:10956 length:1413 start_codon:yes stop_codon:yes gene_type:complete
MAIYIDDQELVAAHRAGDGEAFEELVREYRQPLIAHAQRKLGCVASSEDAFQETLVRAYRALPNFDGEYRLGPWLHRIMANVCVDEANRRRRDGEKTQDLSVQPAARRNAASPEDELGMHIDDTDLYFALDSLPDPHKEALVLRFVDDLDYDQVAKISGVSEQNARARVSRARAAMRSAMKGVAVLPALLFGLLRRGEKAAAAATSGGAVAASASSTAATIGVQAAPVAGTLPAIAEASTAIAQAAPHAMPMIAKAAVGIGLAAAVLTPTSDSAVHQAVENVATGSAGVIEVNSSSDGAFADTEAGAQLAEQSGVSDIDAKGKVVQSLELAASGEAISAAGTGLNADALEITTAGPGRYDLSGELELVLDDASVFDATMSDVSRIAIAAEADPDGRRRVDGLFVVGLSTGEELELRLAGFAAGDDADLRLAGLFRAVGDTVQLPDRGSFNGTLVISPDSSTGILAFTLTP